MRQGDLVILRFPYASIAESKWRPAVVLSNERYNRHANVIVAGLYGKQQPFSVRITNGDVKNKKLRKVSYVSLQNIFSADKNLIRSSVDTVTEKKMKEVLAALRACV